MSPSRRLRPTGWLTIVIRPRAPREPAGAGGNPALPHRLFLSAAGLLAALALLLPGFELLIFLHDRRAVARDFACVEERLAGPPAPPSIHAPGKARGEGAAAAPAPRGVRAAPSPTAPEDGELVEIDLDGFGRFVFPPGLSEGETVAALQALAVAHHDAGHGPHAGAAPVGQRRSLPPPPAPADGPSDVRASAERGCGVAQGSGAGGDERYSWRAWRREYAAEPPSVRAEAAANRAVVRSLLALLPLALLFGIRAWWRWLLSPPAARADEKPGA